VRTVRETIPVSTPTRHAEGTDLVRETIPAHRRRRFGGLKVFVIIALLAAGAVVGAIVHTNVGSGTTPLTVHVTLMDYMVMPAQRHLPVGKPITFVVTNRGHHTHELVLERANAVDKALRYHGRTYEAADIKPGATRRVTWTVPRKGTYKLACHLDHHYQMGMKTFITAAYP
jgi:uncharacterized cupredoxin-like copper-binding protein